MNRTICWVLAILSCFGLIRETAAQNLVIGNARVIVGNGDMFDRANILILGGRIIEVTEEAIPDTEGLTVIDAQGLTALPGFIDAHRDVIQGDPDVWLERADQHMRGYLESGVTTVLSVDHELEHVLKLRDRLEAREIEGPRIIVSGHVPLTDDRESEAAAAQVQQIVQEHAYAGADAIVSVVAATEGGAEKDALSAARDEADNQGLMTVTHIKSVADLVAAVDGGSGYLTGTPNIGTLDEETAARVVSRGQYNAEYGLVMTSALGAATDAGTAPANARLLHAAGIRYGFGTGTTLPPQEALRHEVNALGRIFSSEQVLDSLTRQAAYAARRDDALGLLRLGRVGDVVLVGGDPLADLEDLYDVRMVVRSGRIVVDQR